MFSLKRVSEKPILVPNPDNRWERKAVFNCAAIYDKGFFHLFYRASDNDFKLDTPKPLEENKFTSSIGYAKSKDGINFERFSKPLITGKGKQEAWGVEDPRITKVGGVYYMLFTSFGGRRWDDIRISIIRSYDLKTWSNSRVLLDEPNKDAALLCKKIEGKYVLFHRRHPNIWISFSEDLKTWFDHQIVMTPITSSWDSKKIGIAGPPIKIDDGWLLIYHGVDKNDVYRLGAALLDYQNPTKVLARQREPILSPELPWEKEGLVPNVVFSCGAVDKDNIIYVYYGAADTCIGLATVEKDKVKF